MKRYILLVSFLGIAGIAKADIFDKANIFGSMQSFILNESESSTAQYFDKDNVKHSKTLYDTNRTSFALQQMDIFFSKEITDDFKMFVDMEFKMNFSSEDNWGRARIQEAWTSYSDGDWLEVKAGMLFPKFNNLNDIKNKSFMPYVIRPLVYENMFSSTFDLEAFVPDRAFLQVSGFLPIGNARFEYAAFTGNSSKSYISDNSNSMIGGLDTKGMNFKLFGGRLGVRRDDERFKAGISFTRDVEQVNYNDEVRILLDSILAVKNPQSTLMPFKFHDDLTRYRFGLDLSFQVHNFEFEGEMINVVYDYDKSKNPFLSFGRMFVYSTLLYNPTDNLFGYITYQYSDEDSFEKRTASAYSAGCGYKINEAVTLKAQYIYYKSSSTAMNAVGWDDRSQFVTAAVNVNF